MSRRATIKSTLARVGALAMGLPVASRKARAVETSEESTLWYDRPATDWEHEALPIGNGALGAMVFGSLAIEQDQFNEKTLPTGGPGPPRDTATATGRSPDPAPSRECSGSSARPGRCPPRTSLTGSAGPEPVTAPTRRSATCGSTSLLPGRPRSGTALDAARGNGGGQALTQAFTGTASGVFFAFAALTLTTVTIEVVDAQSAGLLHAANLDIESAVPYIVMVGQLASLSALGWLVIVFAALGSAIGAILYWCVMMMRKVGIPAMVTLAVFAGAGAAAWAGATPQGPDSIPGGGGFLGDIASHPTSGDSGQEISRAAGPACHPVARRRITRPGRRRGALRRLLHPHHLPAGNRPTRRRRFPPRPHLRRNGCHRHSNAGRGLWKVAGRSSIVRHLLHPHEPSLFGTDARMH